MTDKKTFDYHSIFYGLSADLGRFRLAQNGMGWKGPRDRTVLVSPEEVKRMNWIRVARGYELRVTLKDNVIHKFDGFKNDVRKYAMK
jgi:structure-specific recognition protein 1